MKFIYFFLIILLAFLVDILSSIYALSIGFVELHVWIVWFFPYLLAVFWLLFFNLDRIKNILGEKNMWLLVGLNLVVIWFNPIKNIIVIANCSLNVIFSPTT